MRSRRLGRTELDIPELVFGGGIIGGLLIHQDDATKLATVRRALEAGIDWIDTAPSYGDTKSEAALGWILKEVERPPRISTKVRLEVDPLDDVAGQVERSLAQSLDRLGLAKVPLLQLHNPIARATGGGTIALDDVLRRGGAADALESMREQGLCDFVGLTALGDGAACVEAVQSGRFDSAQVYHNMLNPSAARDGMPPAWTGQDFAGLIAACTAHDVGVMNIRVFAQGALAGTEPHGREAVLTEDAEVDREYRKAAALYDALGVEDADRAAVALRFAIGNPDLSCIVIGLAEPAHLETALAAAAQGPLDDEALSVLESLYATDFASAE